MRSTGFLFLIGLILGCSAGFDDPVADKAANDQVSAILDAVKARDQTALKVLFKTDPRDIQRLGVFIDQMQGISLNVKSTYFPSSDGSIRVGVKMADKVDGTFNIKKNAESKTGWQVDSMIFNKNRNRNSSRKYNTRPVWLCYWEPFQCVMKVLHNWGIPYKL